MKRNLIRKTAAAVMSLLLSGSLTPVSAASQVNSRGSGWEYRLVQNATGRVFDNGETVNGEGIFTIQIPDGSFVPGYCIDPDEYMTFNGYTFVSPGDYDLLSREVKERLNLITYFGYQYGSHTGDEWYLATQSLVYDAILGGISFTWTNVKTGEKSDFAAETAEISMLIQDYLQQPSFAFYHEDGTKAGSSSEFEAGETVRITDENGKLSRYRMTSLTGGTLCTSDGSTLDPAGFPFHDNEFYVRIDQPGECRAEFVYSEAPPHSNAQFILRRDGKQDLITAGALSSPLRTSVSFSAPVISIFVQKAAAEAEGTPVSGAGMRLIDETDPSSTDDSWEWISSSEPHECRNLIPSHSYAIEEISAPKGRYLMQRTSIGRPVQGHTYSFQEGIRDEPIRLQVWKQDALSGEMLAGVTLQLKENGSVLHEWVTDGTPHEIGSYLEEGKTYTIAETETLAGYYFAAEETSFTVSALAPAAAPEPLRILNYPIEAEALKTDADTGQPASGAALQLLDSSGQVLHEWVSGQNPYQLGSFLKPGESYRIREVSAPRGYYVPENDAEFTVGRTGPCEPIRITVEDHPVRASVLKVSASDENPVASVTMQLQTEGGTVLDEWITDGSPHEIGCFLTAGERYRIHEVSSVSGFYFPKEDLLFSVPQTMPPEPIVLKVEDEPVRASVLKVNAVDGKPLAGVTLQMFREDGTLIDEWKTDGRPHEIGHLLDAGGTYRIHESASVPGYYFQEKDLIFSVERTAPADPIALVIRNEPIEYRVDKINENGKAVEGARMQLCSADGKLLDEWVTDGTLHDISDFLYPGGTYMICEKDASVHYYLAVDQAFGVPQVHPYGQSADNPQILTVTNRHIKYRFAKTDENGNVVEGAHLAVYDITEDKELSEDNLVFDWSSTSTPVSYNNLERGHTYQLVEYGTVQGHYATHGTVWTIPEAREEESDLAGKDIRKEDDSLYITITAINADIRLLLEKTDPEGNPVSGASLVLVDETEGREVASYLSGSGPIEVDPVLLEAGHTYQLEEQSAPLGYYAGQPCSITLPQYAPDDMQPLRLVMTDEKIEMSALKTDPEGTPCPGAELEILDRETGESVYRWITGSEPQQIGSFLAAGRTYVLHETAAADGFYLAEDIQFEVPMLSPSQPLQIVMKDEPVTVLFDKRNPEDGKSVQGARLVLKDSGGTVLHEWISSDQSEDLSSHLKAGESYVIHEEEVPDGFYPADDLHFDVPLYGEGEIRLTMEDAPIRFRISKKDPEGGMISGALLLLLDEEGNVVDSWESGEQPHEAGHLLRAGGRYTVHEERTPQGRCYAEDTEFEIPVKPDAETAQELTITDEETWILVSKTDEHGIPVKGVQLRLYEADTKKEIALPDGGITGDQPFELRGILEADRTYVLHEEKAVPGVHPAADVIFRTPRFSAHGAVQITMRDEKTGIVFRKTDRDGRMLSGAEISVLEAEKDAEGNWIPRQDESGNPVSVCSFVTRMEPQDLSIYLTGGETYILHEEKAPEGYVLSSDIVFEAAGTEKSTQTVVMIDAPVPETPETGAGKMPLRSLAAGSILVILMLFLKRKR